jgi:hypothetical protein
VIFTDGEERQFLAEALTIGKPSENLVQVDLADRGQIIIPFYAIKVIHTEDLPADAISPDVFG